jgi:hypothetical protein
MTLIGGTQMQAQLKVQPSLIITLEEDKQSDLFKSIAQTQEVFCEKECGKCGSNDLRFIVRKNKDEDEFYELRCQKCHAVLSFGLHKKGGTMYPHRTVKDEDGNTKYLQNRGWRKWNKDKKCME